MRPESNFPKLERALEQAGAVLIRNKRHRVFKLPNGVKFTAPNTHTPSDRRTEANALANLRRVLGTTKEKTKEKAITKMTEQVAAVVTPTEETKPVEEIYDLPVLVREIPEEPPKSDLRARIEEQIKVEKALEQKLMDEAAAAEKRAKFLSSMLTYAEDPALEQVLRNLLPGAPATPKLLLPKIKKGAKPKAEEPAEEPPQQQHEGVPPQSISNHVHVTQQLVYAATKTYAAGFTLRDVVNRMVNDAKVPPDEMRRIRSSISSCLIALEGKGMVVKTSAGGPGQAAIWVSK